jgi:hypothetical protein
MTWTLRLDAASPSQNILDRMHWVKRYQIKNEWHSRIRSAKGFLKIPKATGPRSLRVERHGRGTLDTANLIGGLKGIQDCLVELGLFLDDNPKHLHFLMPSQHTLKRGEHPHTILVIEEVDA